MKIDIERYNKSTMPENAEKYFYGPTGIRTHYIDVLINLRIAISGRLPIRRLHSWIGETIVDPIALSRHINSFLIIMKTFLVLQDVCKIK